MPQRPTPRLITCRVMVDEFRQALAPGTPVDVLDVSLHCRPRKLHVELQRAIDAADGINDPILLGYGLCSQAVVGLVARRSSLVVLRSDDCIGAFLGSRRAQRSLALAEPGSYFLSRGWIGDGAGSLLDEYHRLVARAGERRARAVMDGALRHYRRVVHIVMPGTGQETLVADRAYARRLADTFGLQYREMPGSVALIVAMASGRPHEDVVTCPPGVPITLQTMLTGTEAVPGTTG
jgi:hypothetical protein